MAFWGRTFVFNGIPCDDFDLMLYDIGSNTQGAGTFASTVSVVEETLPRRWKPYLYGVTYSNKLQFSMVFGVNQRRIDTGRFLDRYELEAIASWLTGQNQYMWLEVEQPDLEYVRYRCMISDLKIVEFGNIPWALQASVTCDSPYAYLYPQTFEFDVSGSRQVVFYNESSHNGFYMPKLEIDLKRGTSFTVRNLSDGNRQFSFSGLPSSISKISVDNDLCIITDDQEINIYPHFNMKFFRLVKGENILYISGNGTLRLICEFPVNVGG